MLMLVLASMLVGAVLGLRFRILVLVPALLLMLALVVAGGLAHGDDVWSILLALMLGGISIQLGYLGGTAIRFTVAAARAPRLPVGTTAPTPTSR